MAGAEASALSLRILRGGLAGAAAGAGVSGQLGAAEEATSPEPPVPDPAYKLYAWVRIYNHKPG